ncbi:hypothetical protein D3C87_2154960 [compost metagenome]
MRLVYVAMGRVVLRDDLTASHEDEGVRMGVGQEFARRAMAGQTRLHGLVEQW